MVAASTACGPLGEPTDAQGGMGLPQQLPGESYRGRAAEVTGEVMVGDDGCAYLADGESVRLVIWPAGSELSTPVRLPDGTELRDGDGVGGSARVVRVDALPGGPDGYWAHVTGFCDAGADEVVVFDAVSATR